jgi:mRNA interferase HigB
VEVYREAVALRFAMKHPAARKPLRRFVEILKRAEWPHFAALRETFASADYASGRVIFNIGGNKYRVLASIDFAERIVVIDKVMTHEEYDRETF